jgi:hypothetical protein
MTVFNLLLTSNESTFKYSFSQEFLSKDYEIGLIKMDGELETDNKINITQTNNIFAYNVNGIDKNNNEINELQLTISSWTL